MEMKPRFYGFKGTELMGIMEQETFFMWRPSDPRCSLAVDWCILKAQVTTGEEMMRKTRRRRDVVSCSSEYERVNMNVDRHS